MCVRMPLQACVAYTRACMYVCVYAPTGMWAGCGIHWECRYVCVSPLQACGQAVAYIGECCQVLKQSLDGKNLEVVLMELGIRLHRVIFEHIQQFTINELGKCPGKTVLNTN